MFIVLQSHKKKSVDGLGLLWGAGQGLFRQSARDKKFRGPKRGTVRAFSHWPLVSLGKLLWSSIGNEGTVSRGV